MKKLVDLKDYIKYNPVDSAIYIGVALVFLPLVLCFFPFIVAYFVYQNLRDDYNIYLAKCEKDPNYSKPRS